MPLSLPGTAIRPSDADKETSVQCPKCKRNIKKFNVGRDSHTKKIKRYCPFCNYEFVDSKCKDR